MGTVGEIVKHSWLHFNQQDLQTERQQCLDEGKDLSSLETEFAELQSLDLESDPSLQSRVHALMDRAEELPMREDYSYEEPSDLVSIRALRPDGPRRFDGPLTELEIFDRIHAAWVGRCAGNLLGKPIETWRSEKIWSYLKDLGQFPLSAYIASEGPDEVLAKYELDRGEAFIDRVPHAVEDDDLNYTVSGLAILKKRGSGFTPNDVAQFWLENIPAMRTYTAERVAYRNFMEGIDPPRSASYRNPYREWIGAQIRADFWGYAALGNPELAAEYAWRDASISHVKNGIYGEMWVAAMIASAPFVSGAREVLQTGLAEVPVNCRLASRVREIVEWKEEGLGYDEAVGRLHERCDEHSFHDWCHTLTNAQVVAVGLLWGEDQFESSICKAVQACFDTDCNGATVGSIHGMRHGLASIPDKWSGPLNDRLETAVMGYLLKPISELAKETFETYRSLRGD